MLARRLISAATASALFAADVVLLTLALNPDVRPTAELPSLLGVLFLPYWLGGTLLLLALAGLLALVRVWPAELLPPIGALPSFTTFAFVVVSSAAALFFTNLQAYRDSIPVESVRSLEFCAAAFLGFALVLAVVAFYAWLRPQRARGASAAFVVLAAAAALVVPLAARPEPRPPVPPLRLRTERVAPPRRVFLVGVDGLSTAMVREGVQRGRLPALARLLRRGAHGALKTLTPTEGPPVWASIVTGRLPRDHGVKGFTRYRLRGSTTVYDLLPKGLLVSRLERSGLVVRVPVSAASRRKLAVWQALNAFGIETGVVRLFGTHPAQELQGFMLSNYFYVLRDDRTHAKEALFPPDLLEEMRARSVSAAEIDQSLLARLVDRPADAARDPVAWQADVLERALAPDLSYERAGRALRAAYDPSFFATYFYGVDVLSHSFMRYTRPDELGDVPERLAQRYGLLIERYAGLVSEWVSGLADGLRGDDVLLLVSGYGLEPAPAWRRAVSAVLGDPPLLAEHAGGDSGFLLAVGAGVRGGSVIEGASVLDLAPTILYLMGLPVARDMEGRVLIELLDSRSTRSPMTFIPSYESLAVGPGRPAGEPELPPLPDEVP